MSYAKERTELRKKRHRRIRKKLEGTSERPRLMVFRSLKHIYAQVIDDGSSTTIAAASTSEKNVIKQLGKKGSSNKEAGKLVGELIAKRLKEKSISTVVFDRGGYLYHGRVKALADGAREAGLDF